MGRTRIYVRLANPTSLNARGETMMRNGSVGLVLLAWGLAAACSEDSSRREVVAPDARVDAATAASRAQNGAIGNLGNLDNAPRITIRDDCDPNDPAWTPTGGCMLKQGHVTFAEFGAESSSPLSLAVIGHQAWRNDPSYLEVLAGMNVHVRNVGGRVHTFTEVAQFGGGRIPNPGLNRGLTPAPECPGSVDILPGGRTDVSGLAPGNHKFQCCIHPWMRAMIKVKPAPGSGS